MNKCKCGRIIGSLAKYCAFCKENLSLREKVIEDVRMDNIFTSRNLNKGSLG